jgi:hypothetical protein
MVSSPAGLRPEKDSADEAKQNYRPILSSERAPQNAKPQLCKENLKGKEKLVAGPDFNLPSGQIGRLTIGREITLTLIFSPRSLPNLAKSTSHEVSHLN